MVLRRAVYKALVLTSTVICILLVSAYCLRSTLFSVTATASEAIASFFYLKIHPRKAMASLSKRYTFLLDLNAEAHGATELAIHAVAKT